MTPEDKAARHDEVARAERARAILGNPLWSETFERYEENLQSWMTEPRTKDEDVLDARRMLIALRRMRSDFETTLQTGELAQIQLNDDHA